MHYYSLSILNHTTYSDIIKKGEISNVLNRNFINTNTVPFLKKLNWFWQYVKEKKLSPIKNVSTNPRVLRYFMIVIH